MSNLVITSSALATSPDWPELLQDLDGKGLRVVLIGRVADAERARAGESGARWLPGASGPEGEPLGADEIGRALGLDGRPSSEGYLVAGSLQTCQLGDGLGCRTVLVLGERELDTVIGPGEPPNKAATTALDLAHALRYVSEEHRQSELLGAFPYGPSHVAEERPAAAMPTAGDLAKIFGLSVVAGVAVALGIAYLLQEVYQQVQFPRIFYWLTLQFIPQTLRGLMFLLIGTGAGLLLPRLLSGLTRQRRSFR